MESEVMDMIVKNVKIDKIVFVKTYIREEWMRLLKECHGHYQEDKKEFISVYFHYKKNSKMKINEHQNKGCDKAVNFEGNPFKLKLYVATLALGSRPKQGLAKVQAKTKAQESHFMPLGM
jgi:hypothetical protein